MPTISTMFHTFSKCNAFLLVPIQSCKAILREMWDKIPHCMAQCIARSHCGTSPDLPPYFYDLTTLSIGTYFANNETKWFGTDCRLVFNVIGSFGFPTLHRPRRSSLDPSILSILGSVPPWLDAFFKHHDDGETNLAILRVKSANLFWMVDDRLPHALKPSRPARKITNPRGFARLSNKISPDMLAVTLTNLRYHVLLNPPSPPPFLLWFLWSSWCGSSVEADWTVVSTEGA